MAQYEKFLINNYKEEIIILLNDRSESNHSSIIINLNNLKIQNNQFYCEVINDIQSIISKWDNALLSVQKQIANNDGFLDSDYTIKENCHVRFANLPSSEDILGGRFPDNECIGLFVQVKGNVVQITQEKLLETKREMICSKCNSTFTFEAQYGKMYKFDIPEYCLEKANCRGTLRLKNNLPKPEFCMDFQQIRIQEIFPAENENYPTSLIICLENDLVNTCKPGECLTICGTVEVRWRTLTTGVRGLHVLSLRANSIIKENLRPNVAKDFNEQMFCVRAQWQENVEKLGYLKARNLILDSLCPEIIGMSYIKLGLALALCSGNDIKKKKNSVKRGHSHVLIVGDPGTGKSKLLKFVCQVSIGAINTNGLGCSAAGLTAAAFKEGSEWNLQAGALVLADGGVCCIDQFNLMQQHDKAAVHETMEQQTVSIAKAGLVCKLQTQCVILASANVRANKHIGDEKYSSSNIGIGTPLLSRFDLIFPVDDEREVEKDLKISNHLLKLLISSNQSKIFKEWTQQRLQSHFIAVKEINPKFNDNANLILGAYYKYYRSNFNRDLSRTTVRMLDSINRLAQSHSRMMFRNEVLGFDAIVVIQLVEATLGFGKIIKPCVNEIISFSTDERVINTVLSAIDLLHLQQNILEEKQFLNGNQTDSFVHENTEYKLDNSYNKSKDKNSEQSKIINDDRISLLKQLNFENVENSLTKLNEKCNFKVYDETSTNDLSCNEKTNKNFNSFRFLNYDNKEFNIEDKTTTLNINILKESAKYNSMPSCSNSSNHQNYSLLDRNIDLSENLHKTQEKNDLNNKEPGIFIVNEIKYPESEINQKLSEKTHNMSMYQFRDKEKLRFGYSNITDEQLNLNFECLSNLKAGDLHVSPNNRTDISDTLKRKTSNTEKEIQKEECHSDNKKPKSENNGQDHLNLFRKTISETDDLSFLDFNF